MLPSRRRKAGAVSPKCECAAASYVIECKTAMLLTECFSLTDLLLTCYVLCVGSCQTSKLVERCMALAYRNR